MKKIIQQVKTGSEKITFEVNKDDEDRIISFHVISIESKWIASPGRVKYYNRGKINQVAEQTAN